MAKMPISRPSLDKAKPLKVNGFTLIELLIVMAIMSLMAVLVVINAGGNNNRQNGTILIKDLQTLRQKAINSSRAQIYDPSASAFSYNPAVSDSSTLVFYPDGSSTGGDILSENGQKLVTINWYNGAISNAG